MGASGLVQLPGELHNEIATYLSPLSRASFLRALAKFRISLSLSRKNESCARVWDLIFKDDEWIRQVLQHQNPFGGAAIPCLVGCDLKRLYYGKPNSAYLTLLVNDWTGDVQYMKELFFMSLRDHEYDKEKSEIRLKSSGITVHIGDVVTSEELLIMTAPTKLFCGRRVSTKAMYYTEDVLYDIGPNFIGGIEGVSTKKKKAFREICSVKLKFRDGSLVYRVFSTTRRALNVVGIQEPDENGKLWPVRWRYIMVP
ncbi:hypothetical protein V8F06_014818 [Rhypophila decipiens]